MFPSALGSPGMNMNPAMMSGFMAGLQSAQGGGQQCNGMPGGGMGGMGGMDPRMMMMMRQSQEMMMMEQMMQMLFMMMSGQMGNNMGNGMGQGGPGGINACGGPGGGGPMGNFGGNYGGGGGNYGGGGGMNNVWSANGTSNVPMGPAGQGNDAAVNLARQFVGQDSQSIRGQMPHFTAAGGQTKNCADFVSSALESTGGLKGHHVGVSDLENALKQQGYHQVPQSQAKPGDVWMSASRSHTELVTAQGGTRAIGSNNDRPGHQVISEKGLRGGGIFYSKG